MLIVHGANPVHSLPAASGFAQALGKVKLVVSTASMPDETSALAHLVLPDHTTAESWGDAAPRPGVRSIVQPTLRPLYDTRAFGDTLLDSARAIGGAAAASLPVGQLPQRRRGGLAGHELARRARARRRVRERRTPLARVRRRPGAARVQGAGARGRRRLRAARGSVAAARRRPRREPAAAPGDAGPDHEDHLAVVGRDQHQAPPRRSASRRATCSRSRRRAASSKFRRGRAAASATTWSRWRSGRATRSGAMRRRRPTTAASGSAPASARQPGPRAA